MRLGVALIVALSFVVKSECRSGAFYQFGSNVISLSPEDFQQVLESDKVWMVEFYNPGCGFCRLLTPKWESAATSLKRIVMFGGVDCSASQVRLT